VKSREKKGVLSEAIFVSVIIDLAKLWKLDVIGEHIDGTSGRLNQADWR